MDLLQLLGTQAPGSAPQQGANPVQVQGAGLLNAAPNMGQVNLGSAMKGIEWDRRNTQYHQLMQQQQFLNDLAKQQEEMRVKEYKEAAPYRKEYRGFQENVLKGMAPYATSMAETSAKAGIAKNKFDTVITYGPEAQQEKLREWRSKEDDRQWNNRGKALSSVPQLMDTAEMIRKQQGDEAAKVWLKEQFAHYRKMPGIAPYLPSEAMLENPAHWSSLSKATKEHLKMYRDQDLEFAKLRNQKEIAQINANATKGSGATVKAEMMRERNDLQKEIVMNANNLDAIKDVDRKLTLYNTYVMNDWNAQEAEIMKVWRAQLDAGSPLVMQIQEKFGGIENYIEMKREAFWISQYGGNATLAKQQENRAHSGDPFNNTGGRFKASPTATRENPQGLRQVPREGVSKPIRPAGGARGDNTNYGPQFP